MIQIDLESTVPLEEQLRQAVREAIARGEVLPGQELPSSRQLAADLGIHWNTVARAYRSMRDDGLLVIGRGRGVLVRAREGSPEDPELRERVIAKMRDAVTEARLGGIDLDAIGGIFQRHLESWQEEATS